MKFSTTASGELVTCQECGNKVAQRDAIGIGPRGRLIWTCTKCVTDESMDKAFAPLGQILQTIREGGKQ